VTVFDTAPPGFVTEILTAPAAGTSTFAVSVVVLTKAVVTGDPPKLIVAPLRKLAPLIVIATCVFCVPDAGVTPEMTGTELRIVIENAAEL
jgi:hypothetical protein